MKFTLNQHENRTQKDATDKYEETRDHTIQHHFDINC